MRVTQDNANFGGSQSFPAKLLDQLVYNLSFRLKPRRDCVSDGDIPFPGAFDP